MNRPTNDQLIERWENCKRVLENLSPHDRELHWDMSLYLRDTACGTVGCAAGHCSMDPWFQSQGLIPTLHKDDGWYLDGDIDLDKFFGRQGSRNIFHDYSRRSVETVIEEVTKHIQWLKDTGYEGDDWDYYRQ